MLIVAACGNGAAKTSGPPSTTTTSAGSRGAALQPFVQCMRNHGVAVTGRGFRGGAAAGTGGTSGGALPATTVAPATTLPPGVTQQQYDAALATCRSLIPNRQGSPAFAAYRNCVNLQLQQHGAPTLPPPGQGGGGALGGGGNGGTTATTNPALPAAVQACAALRPTSTSALGTTSP